MSHVLVTGSDGFIGQWLCRQLRADGHTVAALDKRALTESADGYRKHVVDILDAEALRAVFVAERPDALVHLAARTDLDESVGLEAYADNIEGVRNVCHAVRAVGTVGRAVYTSTQLVCEIGYRPTADDDYRPSTVYGRSKVRTEQIVREEDGGGATWCIARPTTVWGPGMNEHYQSLLRYIQQGRYFHVGRSPLYKSYSYVENIAYQFRRLLDVDADQVRGRTFYLADYEPLSLRAYTDGLQQALGARPIPSYPAPVVRLAATAGDALNALGWRSFPFNSFRLTNILTEYILDLSRTEAVCGPVPVGPEEGIRKTAEWFEALRAERSAEAA